MEAVATASAAGTRRTLLERTRTGLSHDDIPDSGRGASDIRIGAAGASRRIHPSRDRWPLLTRNEAGSPRQAFSAIEFIVQKYWRVAPSRRRLQQRTSWQSLGGSRKWQEMDILGRDALSQSAAEPPFQGSGCGTRAKYRTLFLPSAQTLIRRCLDVSLSLPFLGAKRAVPRISVRLALIHIDASNSRLEHYCHAAQSSSTTTYM